MRSLIAWLMFVAASLPGPTRAGEAMALDELARIGLLTRDVIDRAQIEDWRHIQSMRFTRYSSGPVTVFHAGQSRLARTIVAHVNESRTMLAPWLGRTDSSPVAVYLYPFSAQPLSARSAAYATRAALHLVSVQERFDEPLPARAVRALRHELVHLATLPFRRPRPYVPWLSEGLAYYLESRLELRSPGEWLDRFLPRARDAWRASWLEMSPWEDYYRTPRHDVQAASILAFLEERRGVEPVARLVREYFHRGLDEDRALTSVFGLPLEELEAAWRERVRSGPRQPYRALDPR